jgi:EmrB/QacA subfamily drug resistance transporter
MAFIDSTVVNVALPILQSEMRVGISDTQWVIESYSLFLTALVLVGGSLGDYIGRRTTFNMGVVIFSISSAACGLAGNIHALIAARAVQGIGAALLVPSSLALLSAAYPENERGRAIGTWSAFSGLTGALGPVLGGWFVQKLSWRWVFFINVPVGAIVLILLLLCVHAPQESRSKQHLDWLGAAIATLSLAGLVFGLLEVPGSGTRSATVLGTVIAGMVGIVVFVIIEANQRAPIVPVYLFRSKNFRGANILTLLLYAALSGALFFVPFNLIQVQGYSPLQAGAALLPFVLIMFFLSRWAASLVTRYGSRLPLTVGPLITALGLLLYSVPNIGGSYWKTFFPAALVLGLGMATSVAPLTTTIMSSVSQDQSGAASGINNAVARLAGLLAIALLGLTMQSAFAAQLNHHLGAARLPAPLQAAVQQQRSNLAAIEISSSVENGFRHQVQQIVDESFVAAFRRVLLSCAALAAISGLVAALTISHRQVCEK